MTLDYSLKTCEERRALVDQIIAAAPSSQLTSSYLEILGSYILDAIPKDVKKENFITTNNRKVTITKRETSYEELVSKFENGEDGVYNLINRDKNMYLDNKIEITEEDLRQVPGLAELRDSIAQIERQAAAATGKRKYLLKKQAIEMRQQQYILKDMFYQPIQSHSAVSTEGHPIELEEHVHFDKDGEPVSDSLVSFFNPDHISAILCNYENLKYHIGNKMNNDFYYMMQDFDKLMDAALAPYPAYKTLVEEKLRGSTNAAIQKALVEKHDLHHTVEYISALWRNKIPKIIAEKAKEDYLIWYYSEVEYGTWKRCTCCGEWKLAHNRFFSRNSTSKDGWYSICKACRNKKSKEKKKKTDG